jgi:hypothetical protein
MQWANKIGDRSNCPRQLRRGDNEHKSGGSTDPKGGCLAGTFVDRVQSPSQWLALAESQQMFPEVDLAQ